MTDAELRAQGPPTHLDNTLRCQLQNCARKFYWFSRGVKPRDEPVYFTFGRIWGELLNFWYTDKERPSDNSIPHLYSFGVDHCLPKAERMWQDEGTVGAGVNSWEVMERLFKLYITAYPVEDFNYIGAEQGWEWPLEGTPYFLAGALDGYAEWPGYGMIAVEHKTTGVYLGDNYIRQWKFSPQVTIYLWYLEQLLGEPPFGCLMNLATKRLPKTKDPEMPFARPLERRSPQELAEFVADVKKNFEELESRWESWHWPKTVNPIECAGGIGKAPCTFQPLCLTDSNIEEIEPEHYSELQVTSKKWCPWKRGEKGES